MAAIHVRFEGKSFDIPFSDIDIGSMTTNMHIKTALAAYLDVAVDRLRDYVIEKHVNGNITVRPEAVFG